MKSRLLPSATAFALLLGLVSTNLFAQLTNTASVEFLIQSYSQDGVAVDPAFYLASAGNDTVGRQMDVAVRWDAGSQFLSSVDYTITLPVGTVAEATVEDNVYLTYYDGLGIDPPVTIKVDPANVAVTANPLASYEADAAPVVVVTDNNTFTTNKTVYVKLLGDIYIGKALSDVNSETGDKMKLSFVHGSAAGTTINEIVNFYAVNDLADAVQLNEDVTGYVDEAAMWSNIDSLVFVDRFGNYVPDFLTDAADSLTISVGEGAGQFADSSEALPTTAGALLPITNDIMYYPEEDSTVVKIGGGAGGTGVWADVDAIFHQDATEGSMAIFLGAPNTSLGGALGLTFDAPTGAETTKFTFTLEGMVSEDIEEEGVLGVTASDPVEVTREVLPADAAKEIGSIVIAYAGATTDINGAALTGTFTLTLKNRFGEAFDGTIGTICDSVLLSFAYNKGTYDEDEDETTYAIDAAMTTMLNSGGDATSTLERPATLLNGTGIREDLNVVAGGTAAAGGVVTLAAPVYLGTTSHPEDDGIYVVATAFNDPTKTDSVLINVEPSVPVAFDLDTLKANLVTANAEGHIVEGMPIAIDLPIFALDTTYNRVSNLDLNANATFLDAITINGTATINGINILIDSRDPMGYQSTTVQDSISLLEAGEGDYAAARVDSSFIYMLDWDRADSARINLGGVGADSLGLRLNYPAGVNYKLSINWDPAGGYLARTIDLGLFNITSLATTDSVELVAVETADVMVDDTLDLVVSFVLPADPQNILGPNRDEKNITISILDMPTDGSGIPAGIAMESIEVSTDAGENYYAALSVTQDAEDNNSIEFATPIELNATLADVSVFVKIMDFAVPAAVDTFGITIITDATPVSATTPKALGLAPSGPAAGDATEYDFVTVPDSLLPDDTLDVDLVLQAVDADGIEKLYINIYESTLSLDETTNLFVESDPVLTQDSLVYGTAQETVDVEKTILAKDLGTKIAYELEAIDATDDTVASDMGAYIIAPLRGKRKLTYDAVNVADLMRLVYLVAGVVETPKVVDYFGLDLDQSGDFDYPDITAELAIWRGEEETLLASAAGELATDAKVALSYEAIDKANANLMVSLENNGVLNMGVFRIKYDTEQYVLGDAVPDARLKDLTVVSHNNEAEGEYSVVVVNVNGRAIVSGSGTILTIPVSAVGEKFDGMGEVSLLNAGFEEGVQVELSQEALALKVQLPKAFALSQNFPNPFNPSTTIAFDIPEGKEANVRLNVYNMRGQLIRTLVDEVKGEGSYQIQWDGSDNYGRRVSSGVYFYRITTGEFSQTRKMVILK